MYIWDHYGFYWFYVYLIMTCQLRVLWALKGLSFHFFSIKIYERAILIWATFMFIPYLHYFWKNKCLIKINHWGKRLKARYRFGLKLSLWGLGWSIVILLFLLTQKWVIMKVEHALFFNRNDVLGCSCSYGCINFIWYKYAWFYKNLSYLKCLQVSQLFWASSLSKWLQVTSPRVPFKCSYMASSTPEQWGGIWQNLCSHVNFPKMNGV